MRVVCQTCSSRQVGHWCSQCGSILPTPENENYFGILGLPQKINLDEEVLKERFFDLSRAFHPDRAARMKDAPMREIALRKAVLINNSFNTLRDRTRRIRYLIRQEMGEREEKSGSVPLHLFDLVERVNDLMEGVRQARQEKTGGGSADRLVALTADLQSQLQELLGHRENFEKHLQAKEEEWDALCDRTHDFESLDDSSRVDRRRLIEALAVKMDEISYIDSLIRRIKDTLYE